MSCLPLWLGGGLALLLGTLYSVLGFQGEVFESAAHRGIGMGFAALLFCAPWLNPEPWARSRGGWVCAVVSAALLLILLLRSISGWLLGAAATLAIIHGSVFMFGTRSFTGKSRAALITFMTAFVAAAISVRLMWWQDFGEALRARPWKLGLAAVTSAFLSLSLYRKEPRAFRWTAGLRAGAVLAAVILILLSFKPGFDFHDTSFYAGSLELARQGGWLLWDVPSQYGFLNIALAAILPFGSAWNNLYVANSVALLAAGMLVCVAFWRLRPGGAGLFAAVLLTMVSVYAFPGWGPELTGVNNNPSVGAFRFIWCYVLLACVAAAVRRNARPVGPVAFWFGHLSWVAACLWSIESMAFATLIWLPAYGLIVISEEHRGRGPSAVDWRRVGWRGIQPLLLALCAAGLVAAYYKFRLGHFPDVRGYFEYALAYGGGYFSLPVNPGGSFVALLMVQVVLLTFAIGLLRSGDAGSPVVIAALATAWSTSIYFVNRSHDNNVSNLLPLNVFALLAAWFEVKKIPRLKEAMTPYVGVLVPVLTVAVVSTFGNTARLPAYLGSVLAVPSLARFEQTLPGVPLELTAWLRESGVRPDDPFVFVADTTLPVLPKSWLPIMPGAQFAILPSERRQEYLERFTERFRRGGWLAVARSTYDQDRDVVLLDGERNLNPRLALQPFLERKFKQVGRFERFGWVLLRYEALP